MRKVTSRVIIAVIAVVVGWSGLAAGSPAPHAYPDGPVRMIVPWEPGSPEDVLTRRLAGLLEDELDRRIIVVRRPGSLAHAAVATARADGRTFGVITSALVVEHRERRSPVGPDDVRPVGLVSAHGDTPVADGRITAWPDDEAGAWWGIGLPRQTPGPIADALGAALQRALAKLHD